MGAPLFPAVGLGARQGRLVKRRPRAEAPQPGAALRIWIDADAAPRNVKELVFRAANRLQVPTVLVANQRLNPPPGNPLVTAVRVEGGPDVADRYIAENAEAGDLVVTQDIPLAALLVPMQVAVLDPRGDEHTLETIGERLSMRDFSDQLRMGGTVTGGPPPFDTRARQAFAAALDRVLTRLLRSRQDVR
ncbi:MAG: YaiI/YqxD family protein [Gemmatimonadales bacterium]|nr:YaiI/YqxD family protein [Gemmatimonadales bacterium]